MGASVPPTMRDRSAWVEAEVCTFELSGVNTPDAGVDDEASTPARQQQPVRNVEEMTVGRRILRCIMCRFLIRNCRMDLLTLSGL